MESEDESSDDDDYQDLEKLKKSKNRSAFSDEDGEGDEEDEEEEDEEEAIIANNMSWKENLAEKARDAFLQRHSESKNLMRLVYGCYTQSERKKTAEENSDNSAEESEDEDAIGGLFKVAAKKQTELQKDKDLRDKFESCFFDDNFGEV